MEWGRAAVPTPVFLTHGSLSGPRPAVSAATHLGSCLCARRMAGHTLTWHTATPDPDGRSPVMSTLEEWPSCGYRGPCLQSRSSRPVQHRSGHSTNMSCALVLACGQVLGYNRG